MYATHTCVTVCTMLQLFCKAFAHKFSWWMMQWYEIKWWWLKCWATCFFTNATKPLRMPTIAGAPSVQIEASLFKSKSNRVTIASNALFISSDVVCSASDTNARIFSSTPSSTKYRTQNMSCASSLMSVVSSRAIENASHCSKSRFNAASKSAPISFTRRATVWWLSGSFLSYLRAFSLIFHSNFHIMFRLLIASPLCTAHHPNTASHSWQFRKQFHTKHE